MEWRFPIIPMPDAMANAIGPNFAISLVICVLLAAFGLYILWETARKGYDRTGAALGFVFIAGAILFATVGFVNLMAVVFLGLTFYYVFCVGFLYWFVWRIIIRNLFTLIFGSPSEPQKYQ